MRRSLYAAAVATLALPRLTAKDTPPIGARVYIEAHLQRHGAARGAGLGDRLARIRAIRTLGLAGVRLDIEWSTVERQRGVFDWSRTDSIVQELRDAGLGAYGLLTYAPPWAVPIGMPERHRPVVDGSAFRGDTAFAHFAAAAARRYRGTIVRWEIWNEENHPEFWINISSGRNAGPDPSDYLRLFAIARDSVLAADPQASVSIGGLAALSGRYQDIRDPAGGERIIRAAPGHVYLRQLIASGWRAGITALHPYSGLPPGMRRPGESSAVFPDQVFDSVVAVLDEAGFRDTPIWITEWGVSPRAGLSQARVTAWLDQALHVLLCHPRVRFVTIYALTDPDPATSYGLFAADGTPTAVGKGLSAVLSNWKGCNQ